MNLVSALRARLAAQDGFSMLAVMMVMTASAMFVAAGYAAANGDLPVSRNSQDRKAAYAAAESGINFYQFKLNSDNDYWSRCTNVPAPNAQEKSPVNQRWNGTGNDTRNWRKVSGATAEYTIELLPAGSYTSCVQGVNDSLIDPSTGTFRIRATGRPNAGSKLRRTINATFRRKSFLDFLYFTDYETVDPAAYPVSGTTYNREWAAANCADRRRAKRHVYCSEIQFADFDRINGPFHTNDDILTCGNPVFGRTAADKIEVSGAAPGHKPNGSGCAGTPVFNGPFMVSTPPLTMPPTNDALKTVAQAAYLFEGKTTIRFNGNETMTVTNPWRNGGAATTMALPSNGVIYVKNRSCTSSIPPIQATYTEGDGCAQVYVSGTYDKSMTIGSQNDIVIRPPANSDNGDLKRANDNVVMGLIANNYVRVSHPVSSCNNVTTGSHRVMPNVRIDAAILSLTHSFLVDNWQCGAKLGKLTVNGAIAQKYRGPVGSANNYGTHGYEKDYNYDDRLRYRSPPYFLDPVAASWTVIRTNEQVPATK
ncbi:MAG TPA: hypothetical protein VN213_00110 [Solirubrobacteraceae bacterium]|nr:hypothetical protein [Solirubrobacteraceae bacterium]